MSHATATSAEQLREAFAEFEQASHTLAGFYQDLERQVANLTSELACSRAAEQRELAAKERLAARLGALLDALPGGVVVLDQHGLVQEYNPAACDLLGALARGDNWAQVVARAFAPRWDDGHDISLVDGRRVNIATQALGGEPGQILLLKDVSETRRLQDQLAHHKRLSAKTEMAAALAHQIRTPLATALLNTGNLRRARNDAERERAVSRAVKSLRKLERLVDEMLLFARGGQLAVETVSVADLVAAIDTAQREAFSLASFAVEWAPLAVDGAVNVNLAALTSIALNLIDNAAQACAGRGRLRIAAALRGDAVEFAFSDEGPGIAAAERQAVFEPFFTTRANGTGLGLPVARAVARAHGGELELQEGTAVGTTFLLRLPLAVPDASPYTTSAPAATTPRVRGAQPQAAGMTA